VGWNCPSLQIISVRNFRAFSRPTGSAALFRPMTLRASPGADPGERSQSAYRLAARRNRIMPRFKLSFTERRRVRLAKKADLDRLELIKDLISRSRDQVHGSRSPWPSKAAASRARAHI